MGVEKTQRNQALLELLAADPDITVLDAARTFGISIGRVSQLRKAGGLPRARAKLKRVRLGDADYVRRTMGIATALLAKQLGVSARTVSRARKRFAAQRQS